MWLHLHFSLHTRINNVLLLERLIRVVCVLMSFFSHRTLERLRQTGDSLMGTHPQVKRHHRCGHSVGRENRSVKISGCTRSWWSNKRPTQFYTERFLKKKPEPWRFLRFTITGAQLETPYVILVRAVWILTQQTFYTWIIKKRKACSG